MNRQITLENEFPETNTFTNLDKHKTYSTKIIQIYRKKRTVRLDFCRFSTCCCIGIIESTIKNYRFY